MLVSSPLSSSLQFPLPQVYNNQTMCHPHMELACGVRIITDVPDLMTIFTGLSPELVGLSLVYAVSLAGQFQYCIRQSAEMENIVC